MATAAPRQRKKAAASPAGNGAGAREEPTDRFIDDDADGRLRAGREVLGVSPLAGAVPPLGQVVARAGGWYPLAALGLLIAADDLQTAVFTTLAPEVSVALGTSKGTVTALLVMKTLLVGITAVLFARLVQHRPHRARLAVGTAVAWGVLTGGSGFALGGGMFLGLLLHGAAAGSVPALHGPLLFDWYPPEARVRTMSLHRAADAVGAAVGALLIGVCSGLLGFSWRGVLVVVGVVSLAAAAGAARLREPRLGRWDTERLRAAVRGEREGDDGASDDRELRFSEIVRRVLALPTVRHVLLGSALVGMMLTPFRSYLAFFLRDEWGMGPGARSAFTAVMSLLTLAGLGFVGIRGEGAFRRDPAALLRLAAAAMAVATAAVIVAPYVPVFVGMVVVFGAVFAAIGVVLVATQVTALSVVPAPMRPHVAALQALAMTGVGGIAGLVVLGGIDRRFGPAAAIVSVALPGALAALILRQSSTTVNTDLDRLIGGVVEEEEIEALRAAGTRLPMLACRHIDFSYGNVQVLFDVNFAVEEGEMVALLGTNGAGKSTLLNVISGVGVPHGRVRLDGIDITYLEATSRVAQGIRHIPGGRGVFGPLSVAENLRVLGYVNRKDRREVERGIDATFDAFPRLAERRNQRASTLSGGEQQMLTLASAYLCRPRLLLIDELSLGLAPKIVGELLEMVRRIHSGGTAVLLVEQSVTTALSLVDHAYFMEKGEIRFDGRASDLLARPDLLRSVFLEGAAAGNGNRR